MPTTYVITATHPDGTPYLDDLSQALAKAFGGTVKSTGITAYGDADRDQRVAAIRTAGLVPHVRKA